MGFWMGGWMDGWVYMRLAGWIPGQTYVGG